MSEYIIFAYSPSTGVAQRELQLENSPITDPRLAQMHADSFATRLNSAKHNATADWQPRLETVDPNFHVRTG
jgi:hypothetical protein